MADIKKIKSILAYNTSRPYFGSFTAANLSEAFSTLKCSQSFDKPLAKVSLYIGDINGDVICNSLWNQMSYNPVRFGNISPFYHNGRNNIYRFCEGKTQIPTTDATANGIICEIRHKLIDFMNLNRGPNSQWQDIITTRNGYVDIAYEGAHSNSMYKMLANLRECVKLVARQNVADLGRRREPYRAEIIRATTLRHPELEPKPVVEPTFEVDDEQYDKVIENLEITLANAEYYSPETIESARAEYEWLIAQQAQHSR